MLFERQRLLLTLLDALRAPVSNTDFQKLLFLYTQECEASPTYEFVPYKFGGFSFTSYADKRRLMEAGLLHTDDHHWILTDGGHEIVRKHSVAPLVVAAFCRKRDGLRGDDLIAEQYRKHPYYAIRSEIVERVLPDLESRNRVKQASPAKTGSWLVTIGYEGKCLENYLNQLIRSGVTLLCDVRRNPLSRKYGFSKSTLSKACEGVGIRYEHLPTLGIASEERRNLETQADYDALFAEYEATSLPKQTAALAQIQNWISEGQKVALTCFELLPHQCHRHCVSEAIEHAMNTKRITVHL